MAQGQLAILAPATRIVIIRHRRQFFWQRRRKLPAALPPPQVFAIFGDRATAGINPPQGANAAAAKAAAFRTGILYPRHSRDCVAGRENPSAIMRKHYRQPCSRLSRKRQSNLAVILATAGIHPFAILLFARKRKRRFIAENGKHLRRRQSRR